MANLSRSQARALGLNLYPMSCRGCAGMESFGVHTIDRLFENETLGFAHLDLEYHELEVTMPRCQPPHAHVHLRSISDA